MESPSLVILNFDSTSKCALSQVMDVLLDFGKAFYYSPNRGSVRVLLRSRAKMDAIINEVRTIGGVKVRRYYQ